MGLLPGRVAIALPGRLRLLRVPPAQRAREGERPGAAHQGVGTAWEAVDQRGRLRGPPAGAGPLVTTRPRAATADGLWLGSRIAEPAASSDQTCSGQRRATYRGRQLRGPGGLGPPG